MPGSCECGNEHSGSIKVRDLLTDSLVASRERFCSMGPVNPLNSEINPIRHLLTLVGARHIVHVSHPPFANIGRSSPYCSR